MMTRRDALKTFGFVASATALGVTAMGEPDTYKPPEGWKCVGHVAWNSVPPPCVGFQTHKFSFLDAVEAASLLMDRDWTRDYEELVIGKHAASIVLVLPHFIAEGAGNGLFSARQDGRAHLGRLSNRNVAFDKDLPYSHFMIMVPTKKQYVTGNIVVVDERTNETPVTATYAKT